MIGILAFILIVISPVLRGAVSDKDGRSLSSYNKHSFLHRFKREPVCGFWPNEFRCRDGTCITTDKKCDGTVDCPDGTDETHYLCREIQCPDYLFRCTYGACVHGAAACDGVKDCVDNSDELQSACNNNTLFIIGDQFKCSDGTLIDLYRRCDGAPDCVDSSDETLQVCAAKACPSNMFQCAYGACVDEGANCNDFNECADGSDEHDMLCKRSVLRPTTTTASSTAPPSTTKVIPPNICVLPQHPKHGLYIKNGASIGYQPGEMHAAVYLNITCKPGYKIVGEKVIICINGSWYPHHLPYCARACRLDESSRVDYKCVIDDRYSVGVRKCEDHEVEGTKVLPECKRPNYYSSTPLSHMYCYDGRWSYEPKCQPECGTLIPEGEPLVVGGSMAYRGEVPWLVPIYRKDGDKYKQICSGTLISETRVITAAHCFWDDQFGLLPESMFHIAVGKLYRDLEDVRDAPYVQRSDVKKIILAPRFSGAELLFQDDLAILIAEQPFVFKTYVRPVCLDFSRPFNSYQLKDGNMGMVAGFGLTNASLGSESPELKVVHVPYVGFKECKRRTPSRYASFLVGEKFCAGYGNGTTLCKGDSGAGFVVGEREHGVARHFLRGVLSTAPHSPDGASCNLHALTSFTELQPYARFVRLHLEP